MTKRTTRQRTNEDFAFDRTPPHSIESERSVLGACLLNPDVIGTAVEILGQAQEVFWSETHRHVYAGILELHRRNAPIDSVTLMQQIAADGNLERIGGAMYIAELSGAVPTSANIEYYARIVFQAWQRREIIAGAARWAGFGYGAADENDSVLDSDGLIARVESDILKISMAKQSMDVYGIDDLTQETCDDFRKRASGIKPPNIIPFGYHALDEFLEVLPGHSVVIAARPSVGKTAFALNLAANIAQEKRVLFISLEMSKKELVNRLMQSKGQIDKRKIRPNAFGEYSPFILREKLDLGKREVSRLKLRIFDTPTITGQGILNLVRREKMKHGLDVVIVDYLQLVSGSSFKRNDNTTDKISEVTRLLKLTAKECGVTVISLSQLSRDGDDKPKLIHLRSSGSIEQDADIVILLSRKEKEWGSILADVAKQRDGKIFCVPLRFDVDTQTFSDYAAQDFSQETKAPASVVTGDFFDQQDAEYDPFGD